MHHVETAADQSDRLARRSPSLFINYTRTHHRNDSRSLISVFLTGFDRERKQDRNTAEISRKSCRSSTERHRKSKRKRERTRRSAYDHERRQNNAVQPNKIKSILLRNETIIFQLAPLLMDRAVADHGRNVTHFFVLSSRKKNIKKKERLKKENKG